MKSKLFTAWIVLAALLAAAFASNLLSQATTEESGVIVESVGATSVLAVAGVRAGDMLLSWERTSGPLLEPESSKGHFASILDWYWVVSEQSPRGVIRLVVERRGDHIRLDVPVGDWEANLRPKMSERMLEAYSREEALIEAGKYTEASMLWQSIGNLALSVSDEDLCYWIRLRAAKTLSGAKRWEEAYSVLQNSLSGQESNECQALTLSAIAQLKENLAQYDDAEQLFEAVLDIYRSLWGRSLHVAEALEDFGRIHYLSSDFEIARRIWHESLQIREDLAPQSLVLARSLRNLGLIAEKKDDLDLADSYQNRALEIANRLAPRSTGVAKILTNKGNIAFKRGNSADSTNFYEQALAIHQEVAPETLATASCLNNLGVLARNRGDFEKASDYHRQALKIRKREAPASTALAASYTNLGLIANNREELEAATGYLTKALKIFEKLAPDSLNTAATLNNLGIVARKQGRVDRARECQLRALEIRREQAPQSLAVADSLLNLGNIAADMGGLDSAEKYHREALEIKEAIAPGSAKVGDSLRNLGHIALRRGDPGSAKKYLREALCIFTELTPGTFWEARILHDFGKLARQGKQLQLAADYYERSMNALERQIERLGSSQYVKGEFRSQRGVIYREAIEVQLELGQNKNAFLLLERSRAQSFLALLTERDLIFGKDIPPDLELARRRIGTDFDRVTRRMAALDIDRHREELKSFQAELASLQHERSEIAAEVRRNSPRLGALRYPEPLGAEEVRDALDPGSVLLSFSVGQDTTSLFVVSREAGLETHSIPLGEEQLRVEVAAFLDLMPKAGVGLRGSVHAADLQKLGGSLFRLLIQPAESTLATAERILLVLDGPLHEIPFGALWRSPSGRRQRAQYLIEWKPLHAVLSATVYAQLKDRRESPGELRFASLELTAFGDPSYPQSPEMLQQVTDKRIRSATERGLLSWRDLPSSRDEVKNIAALFPGERVQIYLGKDATEDHVKEKASETRILHFATHGYVDPRFPLNSALVLSIPETFNKYRDNGLLQAWEIFEQLRIDADLVVLSSCQSALGHEQRGEGLIGLTRAFQYAGARTVVATLWPVDDQVTAKLMELFYINLRRGTPKDQALRRAQLKLLDGPLNIQSPTGQQLTMDTTSPYYWASFQIFGDWR